MAKDAIDSRESIRQVIEEIWLLTEEQIRGLFGPRRWTLPGSPGTEPGQPGNEG